MAVILTENRLRKVLSYDPVTGIFVWRVRHGLRTIPGERAGFRGGAGYRQIRIDGVAYFEHRLAYLYMTGAWPVSFVDHANGNRAENQWVNLRAASASQNAANARTRIKQKAGSTLKGVSLDKIRNKWVSFIKVNGKSIYLGTFVDETTAHAAYTKAARSHFGEFGRSA